MKNILFILGILFIVSCDSSDDCTRVEYNTAFAIMPGETYCFPDDTQLTVGDLINEFCPCFTTCVWEGQMLIEMDWSFGDRTQSVVFNSASSQASEPIDNDNIRISVDEESTQFVGECVPDIIREISGVNITVRR